MMRFIDVGDLLDAWEEFMSAASHSLMIKYGLRGEPSEDLVKRWLDLTNRYIADGQSREAAGHAAAKYLFPDYRTHVYASEADNIEALLRLAGGK